MSWVFAIVQAIPILDKWAERAFLSYKNWKHDQGVAKIASDIQKAKAGNTTDLQKDLGDLSE